MESNRFRRPLVWKTATKSLRISVTRCWLDSLGKKGLLGLTWEWDFLTGRVFTPVITMENYDAAKLDFAVRLVW